MAPHKSCNALMCIRIKPMPSEMKTPELAVKSRAALKRVGKKCWGEGGLVIS